MPSYIIKSFEGGVSPYEDKGIRGAFKMGSGLDIRKRVDSLTCQQGLVDETGVTFTDLIRFFVEASDGNTYGVGDEGKIYKRNPLTYAWSLVYTDPDGEILGAAEWPANDGTIFMYWATATKLKRKEIPGLSNWSDVNADSGWPKTDLTTGVWHTMREAGGALMIANKSSLAMVGYDESYTNNALDLIPGNVAKTIVERQGRSIVGTHRLNKPNLGVNAAIDSEIPLAQIGENGEIFYADMNDSIPATRFPGGGIVNPGGVDNEVEQVNFFEWEQTALSWIGKKSVGNLALFGVFNADSGKGGIWSYGRKYKDKPFVLNLEYAFDADEIGAVKRTFSGIIFSYRNGSTCGVKRVDIANKAVGTYEGLDFHAPVKVPAAITTWKYAEVFIAPLPAGTTIKFYYRMNKTGSWVQARMEGGITEMATTGMVKGVFLIAAEGEIFEPKVVLTPLVNATPEVYQLEIFFD